VFLLHSVCVMYIGWCQRYCLTAVTPRR